MEANGLHKRMEAVAGERTYRALGEVTKTHPETVRRYMQGQAPSVEFLSNLCVGLGVNGSWMLSGQGPVRVCDVRKEALRHADPSELLSAIASSLESLNDRVGRLEHFVQLLETRVRGASGTIEAKADATRDGTAGPTTSLTTDSPNGDRAHGPRAADRVQRALAKRASPAAADDPASDGG